MKKIIPFYMFIVIIMISLSGCKKELSWEQKSIRNVYIDIQDMLLDPDSLIIYDCYYIESISTELSDALYKELGEDYKNSDEYENNRIFSYWHFGARNKMGGITESVYFYSCDKNGNIVAKVDGSDYRSSLKAGLLNSDEADVVASISFAEFSRFNKWISVSKTDIEKIVDTN